MKLSKSELEAVIAASTRAFVPFNKLVLSVTRQARPGDAPGVMPLPELAASIEAAGLLHNLVVVRGEGHQHDLQREVQPLDHPAEGRVHQLDVQRNHRPIVAGALNTEMNPTPQLPGQAVNLRDRPYAAT